LCLVPCIYEVFVVFSTHEHIKLLLFVWPHEYMVKEIGHPKKKKKQQNKKQKMLVTQPYRLLW